MRSPFVLYWHVSLNAFEFIIYGLLFKFCDPKFGFQTVFQVKAAEMNNPIFWQLHDTVTVFEPHWNIQLFMYISHDQSPFSGHSLIRYWQLLIVLGLYPWVGKNLFGFFESTRSNESTFISFLRFCVSKQWNPVSDTKSGPMKKSIRPLGSNSKDFQWKLFFKSIKKTVCVFVKVVHRPNYGL